MAKDRYEASPLKPKATHDYAHAGGFGRAFDPFSVVRILIEKFLSLFQGKRKSTDVREESLRVVNMTLGGIAAGQNSSAGEAAGGSGKARGGKRLTKKSGDGVGFAAAPSALMLDAAETPSPRQDAKETEAGAEVRDAYMRERLDERPDVDKAQMLKEEAETRTPSEMIMDDFERAVLATTALPAVTYEQEQSAHEAGAIREDPVREDILVLAEAAGLPLKEAPDNMAELVEAVAPVFQAENKSGMEALLDKTGAPGPEAITPELLREALVAQAAEHIAELPTVEAREEALADFEKELGPERLSLALEVDQAVDKAVETRQQALALQEPVPQPDAPAVKMNVGMTS